METKDRSDLTATISLETVHEAVRNAERTGLVMQTAELADVPGRFVNIQGNNLLSFGTCSYLALDKHPSLRVAAIEALVRIGTQFSISRAYLQSSLYTQLESNLALMTGGHALVTPSTTLGHIAALPVLVHPQDAVVIDQFAHSSLQTAAGLLRCESVVQLRHSHMRSLRKVVSRLSKSHPRVWYVCDGLYSMLGDFVPAADLSGILAEFPNFHCYIDDAHSTSWHGAHGRGFALEHFCGHERVTVALSLNKAFASGGGAIICATPESRDLIRRCGGPMIFSGPLQPPMLAAALASSRLHLSEEFSQIQASEVKLISLAKELADKHQIRLATADRSPIFFVPCGPDKSAVELVQAMRARGFYTCLSAFPAVPRNRAGVRFTVSLHNEPSDIQELFRTMSEEITRLGIQQAMAHSLLRHAS